MTASYEEPHLFSDLALAQRLERAEGRSCAEFVESRTKISPDSGAQWIEVAGAYAMYDGAASPLTQTFGLGLFQPVTHVEMELIENFYRQRSAPVLHEISPLADAGLIGLLNQRGYHPLELTSVMFRSIADGIDLKTARNENIRVRLAGEHEGETWAQTAVKGWVDETEHAASMIELMLASTKRAGALSFLAELEGQPIATGALCISDGVALLAGASTIPEGRKQGAQLALLESRLRYAAEHGCDIAMMGARPGSASQRNAERQGFRIAYTRIKWQLTESQQGER
jgi:acetyltransferase (GNAT) family protein